MVEERKTGSGAFCTSQPSQSLRHSVGDGFNLVTTFNEQVESGEWRDTIKIVAGLIYELPEDARRAIAGLMVPQLHQVVNQILDYAGRPLTNFRSAPAFRSSASPLSTSD